MKIRIMDYMYHYEEMKMNEQINVKTKQKKKK